MIKNVEFFFMRYYSLWHQWLPSVILDIFFFKSVYIYLASIYRHVNLTIIMQNITLWRIFVPLYTMHTQPCVRNLDGNCMTKLKGFNWTIMEYRDCNSSLNMHTVQKCSKVYKICSDEKGYINYIFTAHIELKSDLGKPWILNFHWLRIWH